MVKNAIRASRISFLVSLLAKEPYQEAKYIVNKYLKLSQHVRQY